MRTYLTYFFLASCMGSCLLRITAERNNAFDFGLIAAFGGIGSFLIAWSASRRLLIPNRHSFKCSANDPFERLLCALPVRAVKHSFCIALVVVLGVLNWVFWGNFVYDTGNIAVISTVEWLVKRAVGHEKDDVVLLFRKFDPSGSVCDEAALSAEYSVQNVCGMGNAFEDYWNAHHRSTKPGYREFLCGNVSKFHRYWVTFENGTCVNAGVFTNFPRLDVKSVAWCMACNAEELDREFFVAFYGPPNIVEPSKWRYVLEDEQFELYFRGQKCIRSCILSGSGVRLN